ncbi:hypothetical protein AXF42_Ash013977 [Apostasia shenzhenica]|uniref:Secreted protein n=1 Tax=Apostasia shenzhenica TaxID=1088818 RepID=A0A2I0ASE5_9ASPA|nr:hypothetical protein AXF42_Ash013977 [Apostasia shenzhenica]
MSIAISVPRPHHFQCCALLLVTQIKGLHASAITDPEKKYKDQGDKLSTYCCQLLRWLTAVGPLIQAQQLYILLSSRKAGRSSSSLRL